MMAAQTVALATPFTDQIYSAVHLNHLQVRRDFHYPWIGEVGSYLPEAHNRIVATFLEHTDADRLLIIEQDNPVQPNIVARVSTHRGDVVSGVYFARRPPHYPFIYDAVDEGGKARYMEPTRVADLFSHPGEHPIAACGTGVLSIRRKVLETLPFPWFEPSPANFKYDKGFGGHDLYFCEKVRAAGFGIFCDSSEIMYAGHVGWQNYVAEDYLAGLRPQRPEEVLT